MAYPRSPDDWLPAAETAAPDPAVPANPLFELHHGAEVYTSDGDLLGRVGEVAVQHFKVEVSGAPDYRLERDAVRESTMTGVVLIFPRLELEGHKLDRPAASDALLSRREQQRQRARMERDLERQQARRR